MVEKSPTLEKISPIHGGKIERIRNSTRGGFVGGGVLGTKEIGYRTTDVGHWRPLNTKNGETVLYAYAVRGDDVREILVAGYERAKTDDGYIVETVPEEQHSNIVSELNKEDWTIAFY